MPSLKSFRNRIASVKSIRKITKAMQMVAASNLRRAQDAAEAARPYAEKMNAVIASLAGGLKDNPGAPALLAGSGNDQVHLVIVATADRGLCGGFNTNIVRRARQHIQALERNGKEVKILCVGRKGRDQLKRQYAKRIIDTIEFVQVKRIGFTNAAAIGRRVLDMFATGNFDVCSIVYSEFKSVISQVPTLRQLIPVVIEQSGPLVGPQGNVYEYEPDEETILEELLPRNITTQIFSAMLENQAGFYASQMTAMDNATRNAGDMISALTLKYNRSRQAQITKELIEIISGAEAL